MGDELQLHILELELPKAERPGRLPAALAAWVACFQHGQEDAIMDDVTHPPVQQTVRRLKVLSMDDQARRRAFVRERPWPMKSRH
ncbi:hypothetical protein GCM10023144_25270 [Pigmentiphaga soli]|uniref:Uncharacterized protein n=1 Tax=Pigmentiphaga soli TaxID=1007095 RepID=A0ABP8H346_9BURK